MSRLTPSAHRVVVAAVCAACVIVALDALVAWDGAVITYLVTESPPIVKWAMARTPAALGVRAANAAGYRFDVAGYEAPWQFYVISIGVEWLLLTILIYFCLMIVQRLRRRDSARSRERASPVSGVSG